MDAFRALPTGHPMVAILELDVTDALSRIEDLRQHGERLSLFTHVLRSIAVAMSEHPDMNLVRHGKNLMRFEDVDVGVPVEVETDHGRFPREVVIRRAQDRSAQEIYAELETARARQRMTGSLGDEDRWAQRLMRFSLCLPAFVRVGMIRWITRSAHNIKQTAGTTLVTSVGKFANIPGYSFTFTTGPRAAAFVVGGVAEKPWQHRGQIALRSVLPLSLIIDHDLVDGAPAARFAVRLKELVESSDGLEMQSDTGTASRTLSLAAAAAP
jgi:pyruvate/2-oxoglutarate dehydrogenase complex dihydrolipoamide acyltransferase (E2) component